MKPGDQLTVTWDGLVECEGSPIVPGSDGHVDLSVAEWHGYPSPEPYSPPSDVVSKWTQISLIEPGPSGGHSVTAALPPDLKPGDYYVYVPAEVLIMSPPFTVSTK